MPMAATALPSAHRKETLVVTFKKTAALLGICTSALMLAVPLAGAAVQPNTAPVGYTVAMSKVLTAKPFAQTHASAVCPGTKLPASGGVFNVTGYGGTGVNSSYPQGQIWSVDYDNQTGYPMLFAAYAICLPPSAGRKVVSIDNVVASSAHQSPGLKLCPPNTLVTGGGLVSQSPSVEINLNDSYPQTNGWRVDVDNLSGVDSHFSVYAVCMPKPAGYTIRTSAVVANPLDTVTRVSRGCAAGSVPISGGLYDSSIDTHTTLMDTFPNNTNGWTADEVANGQVGGLVTAYVICAGV
jgi:hypothetical protein